jgi:hypothetical protein
MACMARALAVLLLSAAACSSGSGSGSSTDGAPPAEKPDAGAHSSKGADAGRRDTGSITTFHDAGEKHDVAAAREDSGKSADAGKCTTDDQCNHGKQGTGVVCSTSGATEGECIDGCHGATDCPTGDVCDESSKPHWTCEPMGNAIAALALAQVGLGACSTNTLGGTGFETSCTGYYGEPEYWCADFAQWVWLSSGVKDPSSELGSGVTDFGDYGTTNNTLSDKPVLGAAAIFQMSGSDNHVAIVTQVNSDGTIETVSGDWEGTGSSESGFASTSKVVLNSPAYPATIGSTPSVMGQTLSTFVLPIGVPK